MKQEHKSYDENYKKTIVNLYESGKRKSDLTREYGISYTNINNWIKKYGTIKTSTGEVTTSKKNFANLLYDYLKENHDKIDYKNLDSIDFSNYTGAKVEVYVKE